MDHTVPFRFSAYAGMDIGRDNGGVVDRGYANRAPFAFTGTIKKVTFDIKPHLTQRTSRPCTSPRTTDTWPTASTDSQPDAAGEGAQLGQPGLRLLTRRVRDDRGIPARRGLARLAVRADRAVKLGYDPS